MHKVNSAIGTFQIPIFSDHLMIQVRMPFTDKQTKGGLSKVECPVMYRHYMVQIKQFHQQYYACSWHSVSSRLAGEHGVWPVNTQQNPP